jgi:hypothetical protein
MDIAGLEYAVSILLDDGSLLFPVMERAPFEYRVALRRDEDTGMRIFANVAVRE